MASSSRSCGPVLGSAAALAPPACSCEDWVRRWRAARFKVFLALLVFSAGVGDNGDEDCCRTYNTVPATLQRLTASHL